ncbi:hypothetical protein NQ315_000052 [Exocentrus adspersus]|uniref:Uncharacterized protein n=1 Tax=Exocentrus adspersus TaxID=1586481 RepID=A0AAV8VTV5_9CUCU|nr:hypothetical protein NQ315_000052 [Exocentrus adspersus]
MLRTCINIKQNTDIKYRKLIAFLKRQASGYKPKKSLTFERGVNKFLAEAPNEVLSFYEGCLIICSLWRLSL